MQPVRIGAAPVTRGEVAAVAAGAPVELADDAVERIVASRRVVDDAIARGDAVYGVTTGVGHARDERLPTDRLRAMQPMLLEMHAGAMGPSLPTERVRAGLLVRLAGFAQGGAGVSLPVARGLAGLLSHGIHPVLPSVGSVGTGDLGQLAFVGRVLLGRGEVEVDGQRQEAAGALAAAGLEPVVMEPKDALAVMSSNAVATGHGVLVADRVERLLALGDLVAATSMEARPANPSVVDPVVARARGSAGQQQVSDRVREALAGSARTGPSAGLSVQDPLSFRVVPQVHGACVDLLARVTGELDGELAARSDNPLVDVDAGRVVSNGNFHAMGLALAMEGLRVALGHVGLLAERRLGHLWDAAVTALGSDGPPGEGGPPPLEGGAPPVMAGLGLRYPVAARYTRLRHLANPVTLDVPTLDLGVEDHATNLAEAVVLADEACDIVEELLVVELLTANVLLGPFGRPDGLGAGTRDLVDRVRTELDRLPAGTSPDEVRRQVTDTLRAG